MPARPRPASETRDAISVTSQAFRSRRCAPGRSGLRLSALGAARRAARASGLVLEHVAGAGAALPGLVVGVEQLARAQGEATAANAPVEAVAEPLEHRDLRVE